MILITFGIHLYEKCTKMYSLFVWYIFKTAAIKNVTMVSKHTLSKVGRAITLRSSAHEVVLVKFELQTHIEHLSSCLFGFLVVFLLLTLQFFGYS